MRRKSIVSKLASFSMAALLAFSGCFGVEGLDNSLINNVFKTVEAQAATGTVNADVFSWDNASVYFLLTDRFKNGDTSNDHSYNRGCDKNGNVISNVDDRGLFHGGDFKGVTQTIKDGYFNDLGVNAIWISAPYEQIHGYIVGGDGSPSFAHYSYHGYYVLDYTQTDANFGTEADFKELVDTAHEHGIRVIIDIVLNHAGYNSLYDMNEYGFGVVKDGWDTYYFGMSNVNNKDYHSYIDYEADASQWGKWWGSWVRAGLPGYTASGNDPMTQSLAGLPDFKTESTDIVEIPTFLANKWKKEGRYDQEIAAMNAFFSSHSNYKKTVTNCISYWLSSWVREYGVDGFRCDTAKHVDLASWNTLKTMCTEALKEWKQNNPTKKLDDLDFWMTGECWDHGVSYDGYYTQGGFDSMINFDTTGAGVLSIGTVARKYADYAAAINTKDDFNVLSYMSSHDSTLARGDQVYLGSALLLLPGGVQIYYGDETNRPLVDGIPFDGNGGAGHSLRSDMNWNSIDEEVLAHWQKVGTFRNSHIAVGAGTHTAATASSGVGFVRTYSKGNVSDRIAAVIGASKNTEVSIDVSAAWNNGETVVNYYDSSSAVVTNGKVTFNSGANGTILIGDPDGKPLVTVEGEAKFKGTQTVKVTIKDADSAIISVDGAQKFVAHSGDTFTIGSTAYEGDTVAVSYKATNDKGTSNGKATFYKAYADEDISGGGGGGGGDEIDTTAIVHVKMSDGSAPYLYSWDDNKNPFTGTWPGTKMTQKDAEGYYTMTLDTKGKYNVIFNGGSGQAQTADITGLLGEVYIEVAAGFGSYSITGNNYQEEEVDNVVTIHVKPYGSTAPYLYVWDDTKAYNGGFPGKQLTEKDDAGFYVFSANAKSLNCIVSNGSNQNQSGNITGISGEAWITMTEADNSKYDIEKTAKAESKYSLMKAAARSIKNMTSSEYTTATWNRLYAYVPGADALVAQGEKEADADAVNTMYNNITSAKNALTLATPSLLNANVGSSTVKGKAACEATVTVKINGTTYTAIADEVTGVWTVNASSNLTSSSTITMTAARNGLVSETSTYNMSSGNVNGQVTNTLSASLKVNNSTSALTLALGATVNLSVTASGGSGSYKYKYVVHNLDTDSYYCLKDNSTSSSYSCSMTSAGNKEFLVGVTDSAGTYVKTAAIKVTVPSAALSGRLTINGSASSLSVKVGDTIKLAASASGGSGSYKYKYVVHNLDTNEWYCLKDNSTSSSYSCKITGAGNKEFVVGITDSKGSYVKTQTIKVTATAGSTTALKANLSVNGYTSSFSAQVGSSVKLSVSASGGSGSYKYKYVVHNLDTNEWYCLKDNSTSNSYTCNLTSAGNKEFVVAVTDTAGNYVKTSSIKVTITSGSSSALTAKLTVNGSTGSLTAKVGTSVKLSVSASGGSGSYKYKYVVHNLDTNEWYCLKDNSTSNSYTCKLTAAGNKEFVVAVTDTAGNYVKTSSIKVTATK